MFIYLLIISGIAILIRALVFYFGFRLEDRKTKKRSSILQAISIIVPARNEEEHIERTIKSLLQIDYPKELLEIIIINDRSSDKTLEIAQKYERNNLHLKIVDIKNDAEKGNLQGKAGALDAGIKAAKNEIILMTDADCIVPKNWAKSIVCLYDNDKVGMTASYTLIDGYSFFETMQASQWVYMHTMACAGIGLNQPLGCFGNNVSIRKSAYDSLGGYRAIEFSVTEDLALLQAVYKAGYTIKYLCSESAAVKTLPCTSFKEYYRQQQRWSRGGLNLGWRAMFFVVSSALIWLSLLYSLLIGRFDYFVIMFLLRFFGDFIITIEPLIKLKQYDLIFRFPFAVIFLLFGEILSPISVLDKKIIWKDQTFK